MPKILVILFWLWVASSICIYISRAFRKVSTPKTEVDGDNAEHEELALDDPRRWSDTDQQDDAASDAKPATITPATQQTPEPAVEAPVLSDRVVPVDPAPESASISDVAARLEPVETPTTPPATPTSDADEIEPAVLAAMSPEHRAQIAQQSTAANGGLFDPAARSAVLQSTQSFETKPLAELLAGITMPADLIPSPSHDATEHSMVFVTTSAPAAQVAAELGAELERLGFDVTAQPPSGALATRDGSAVQVGLGAPEPADEEAASATPTVEVTLTAL